MTDAKGQELLDLRLSAGESLPSLASQPFVGRTLAEGEPVISDLIREPLNGQYASLGQKRVLVVDDDRDAVELAATILAGAQADVRTALSVEEALRVFQEWSPEVLVCDIEMPAEDGYTLIRKVRALDAARGGHTAAIALTAHSRVEDRIRSLSAGFTMHLPKPVDPAELVAVVASVT